MDRTAIANAKRITPELFGDTDIAGGIPEPYRPSPSRGPVYFEGKLILALSFQGEEIAYDYQAAGGLVDKLMLWDILNDSWFEPSPTILRCENYDIVVSDGKPVYKGSVNNRYEVALVPGWDSTCTEINNTVYLQWIHAESKMQTHTRTSPSYND